MIRFIVSIIFALRSAEQQTSRHVPSRALRRAPCFLLVSFSLLVLGIVGIGFHFQDLFGVAFAVCRDQQDEFIGVHLSARRAVDGVIAQAGRGLQEFFGFVAAFHEMLDGGLGRSVAI